jgi:hypothetical protein
MGRQQPTLGQLVLTKWHFPPGKEFVNEKIRFFRYFTPTMHGKGKRKQAKTPRARLIIRLTKYTCNLGLDWWTSCGATEGELGSVWTQPNPNPYYLSWPQDLACFLPRSEHHTHDMQRSLKSKHGCIKIPQCSVPSQIQMPITQPRTE